MSMSELSWLEEERRWKERAEVRVHDARQRALDDVYDALTQEKAEIELDGGRECLPGLELALRIVWELGARKEGER